MLEGKHKGSEDVSKIVVVQNTWMVTVQECSLGTGHYNGWKGCEC